MLPVATQFIVCNGPRACAVFRLASAAVNQNQVRLKYTFIYSLQLPIKFFRLITILSFITSSLYKFYFVGSLSQRRAIYL